MLKKYRVRDYNFKLVILLIAITVFGIMAVGSAGGEPVQDKQLAGFLMGMFLMIVLSFFDYSFFLNFYWLMYIGNMVLLILVEFIGNQVKGAVRWVTIAGIQFQPSETAKVLLILFFAQLIMKYKDKFNNFRVLAMFVLLLLPPLGLIFNQPDLSTSIMLAVIFCVLLFVGGISYKIVVGVLAVVVPAAIIIFILLLQPGENWVKEYVIKDYQQLRILAWLHPEDYAMKEAHQQLYSITAIGSGQLWGKGYNTEAIGSVKNGNFIAEPQTDFIFSIIGEEFGFVGSCFVIVVLLLISLECFLTARKAKDLAGALICVGMGTWVGFQSIMNISVTTGLMPNTGITLPFVSAGLTSLVSLFIGMGFVLNVRLQCKRTTNR